LQNIPFEDEKRKSFWQWTVTAKSKLSVMMRPIRRYGAGYTSCQKRIEVSELQLDFDGVIRGTGPSASTKAVLEQMTPQNHGESIA
jgi:hypothetical protein